MTTQSIPFWQRLFKQNNRQVEKVVDPVPVPVIRADTPQIEIAPNDPLLVYLQGTSGPVEVEKLHLDSPALRAMKAAGIVLIAPLVSQGELIGLINLGPRLSEQEYSTDDRRLLADLATQAAPQVRVAQLVQQQQAEARQRERMEQELRVARLIQQTLLPQELPKLDGWSVAAYYQPAREVGGDFYDFHYFEDGRIGIVIGDVTDKGVPAALVMATTRTLLRAVTERLRAPGAVLERVNNLLQPDIPPKMFVTCLYGVLNPHTGHFHYANAGHDLPYWCTANTVEEMLARGMPLGLMPGMAYEEKEIQLAPGDSILLYSDGLVEAHNRQRAMFGFPRLRQLLGERTGEDGIIAFLLDQLSDFTGAGWQQEDDVTLVTIQCHTLAPTTQTAIQNVGDEKLNELQPETWQILGEWTIASVPGNERLALSDVEDAVQSLNLPAAQLDKLKTAVAEATMNAMEHGNHYQPDQPVVIQAATNDLQLIVRITDQGGAQEIPVAETPDLELKLEGKQSPRGWGLFLIQHMVDQMNVTSDDEQHTIELVFNLQNGANYDGG
jgi:serine phosphatase RsbU (regulator of sigma subunit)/anti-sigma regulatory factor (Ser/Thr protein kinase)